VELATESLSVRFGEKPALDRATLRFPAGARVYVGGHAGSGKTTLLKALAGLQRPSGGEVFWEDRIAVSALGPEALAAGQARLGMVFQSDALFDSMSVLENVLLPLRRRGVPPAEAERRARAALEDVGLGAAAATRPEHLSGGMKKRAGLARALVAEPEALLCDDPLAGLDPATAAQVCELLSRFAEGRTLILAAPEPPEALPFPRWVWLTRGRVVHDGPPKPELLEVADEEIADAARADPGVGR
jgi:phospholipid/cholesterol/gamma-HCH transport system ATP-binding protein